MLKGCGQRDAQFSHFYLVFSGSEDPLSRLNLSVLRNAARRERKMVTPPGQSLQKSCFFQNF